MSLKDVEIRASYDSGTDNVLNDFYIKVINEAKTYKRIAGFFSSTSLAVSARGIKGLVENHGIMKLIVSPKLSKEDAQIMDIAETNPQEIIEKCMLKEIEDVEQIINTDHVGALGWLIIKNILEIKVAVLVNQQGKVMDYDEVNESGLFHIKVGIIEDAEGNIISFSGSINETASGWIKNVEEFKVFKAWEEGQAQYCYSDIQKFDSYWNGAVPTVRLYKIPEAIKNRIIKYATQYDYSEITYENSLIKEEEKLFGNVDISLFDYQKKALSLWKNNNYKLICEMATGTGKTRTAIGCIATTIKENDKIVYFVVCPQNTLAMQWKEDIELLIPELSEYVVADSTTKNWKMDLADKLIKVSIGIIKTFVVYVTFSTYCSRDFIKIVEENKRSLKYMIIGDEVHGLGSKGRAKGLLNCYDLRIGLSATPERWFDELGTKRIYEYFGDKTFEFTIHDALTTINPLTGKTYLTPYKYIPVVTTLTDEEIEKYGNLTSSIIRLFKKAKTDEEAAIKLENLMFLRANIHKSAQNKYYELNKILSSMNNDLTDLIIFVSDQQMKTAIDIASKKNIRVHKFTEAEGKKRDKMYGDKSEREYIIEKFKEGDYQALLAIKCLDEGIDIPSAKTAILMASSTNPREYVQRIGRIIRRFKGKEFAVIYDIIIVPNYERMNPELANLEHRIFQKEMIRILEIAENAVNSSEIMRDLFKLKGE